MQLEKKKLYNFRSVKEKPDVIGPVLKPNLTVFRKFNLLIDLP